MPDGNQQETIGRLYAIGVGPGDPELITIKAGRLLSRLPVIFVPQRDETSPGYARSIIAELVREPEQKVIGLVFPMVRDNKQLATYWEKAAETMWWHLKQGQDCAFVNEGDPYLYGTAVHVLETLRATHGEVEITVVPGVPSINAAAAQAALPLAINDERVAILSGHCEDSVIAETLEHFDTIVFLKVNSAFGRLLDTLERLKLIEKCVYISKCTTEDEEIVRDIRQLKGRKLDYLSLLIVRK
ncbi:MAG: precorrin-2 C(20)-methyltransferase [Chloroflexi bacterium]|nr:precorrin-2 C(20)-methyltransferase [Chloroflexota bacterium]